MKSISVAKPKFSGNEEQYLMDCLSSSWISSNGKYIDAFEKSFADFCDVKHAITVCNGTLALHLALMGLNLKPGDEVLVPTVTYIATANAIKYCGATPVLVDVCSGTLNMDPAQIENKITPKTRGIIPVHLYGYPVEMDAILRIAKDYNLFVLEDAAEAHGAKYRKQKIGSIGNCAVFSFYGNKIITTGEGGMITTNNEVLADKCRFYRGQGMDPKRRYWFPDIGYNYRLTNMQAAIGLAQIEKIETFLQERLNLAAWYDDALQKLTAHILLPQKEEHVDPVYWMYTIYLKTGNEMHRDQVMTALQKHGIETRPVFYPLHQLPPYKEQAVYTVADEWAKRGINLPTHSHLTRDEVTYIADTLSGILSVL